MGVVLQTSVRSQGFYVDWELSFRSVCRVLRTSVEPRLRANVLDPGSRVDVDWELSFERTRRTEARRAFVAGVPTSIGSCPSDRCVELGAKRLNVLNPGS